MFYKKYIIKTILLISITLPQGINLSRNKTYPLTTAERAISDRNTSSLKSFIDNCEIMLEKESLNQCNNWTRLEAWTQNHNHRPIQITQTLRSLVFVKELANEANQFTQIIDAENIQELCLLAYKISKKLFIISQIIEKLEALAKYVINHQYNIFWFIFVEVESKLVYTPGNQIIYLKDTINEALTTHTDLFGEHLMHNLLVTLLKEVARNEVLNLNASKIFNEEIIIDPISAIGVKERINKAILEQNPTYSKSNIMKTLIKVLHEEFLILQINRPTCPEELIGKIIQLRNKVALGTNELITELKEIIESFYKAISEEEQQSVFEKIMSKTENSTFKRICLKNKVFKPKTTNCCIIS